MLLSTAEFFNWCLVGGTGLDILTREPSGAQ